MDRFEEYIGMILNGMHLSRKRKKDFIDEIHDHLQMTKNELVEAGYSEEEAEIEAMNRFGDVSSINSSFKKIYTPLRIFKDAINEKKILRETLEWGATIIGTVIISLSIRSYAFAQTEVKQDSMQNTLFEGQHLIEYKAGYLFSEPKRGDIVIINKEVHNGVFEIFAINTKEFFENFFNNGQIEKDRLIKRVIGVPGDEVNIKDGKVYINGECYNEPYVKGVTFPNSMKFPAKVPEKEYFVMGDNREDSLDSRMLGFINVDAIEGKAVFRLWPLDKLGSIYK